MKFVVELSHRGPRFRYSTSDLRFSGEWVRPRQWRDLHAFFTTGHVFVPLGMTETTFARSPVFAARRTDAETAAEIDDVARFMTRERSPWAHRRTAGLVQARRPISRVFPRHDFRRRDA